MSLRLRRQQVTEEERTSYQLLVTSSDQAELDLLADVLGNPDKLDQLLSRWRVISAEEQARWDRMLTCHGCGQVADVLRMDTRLCPVCEEQATRQEEFTQCPTCGGFPRNLDEHQRRRSWGSSDCEGHLRAARNAAEAQAARETRADVVVDLPNQRRGRGRRWAV